jgi:hypothetical protein
MNNNVFSHLTTHTHTHTHTPNTLNLTNLGSTQFLIYMNTKVCLLISCDKNTLMYRIQTISLEIANSRLIWA